MSEPDQERNEQLLEGIARRIGRWQLELPALLFLEVAKPFSFIASQGLLLCQPVLGIFGRDAEVASYAELMADRSNVNNLIGILEDEMKSRGRSGQRED